MPKVNRPHLVSRNYLLRKTMENLRKKKNQQRNLGYKQKITQTLRLRLEARNRNLLKNKLNHNRNLSNHLKKGI